MVIDQVPLLVRGKSAFRTDRHNCPTGGIGVLKPEQKLGEHLRRRIHRSVDPLRSTTGDLGPFFHPLKRGGKRFPPIEGGRRGVHPLTQPVPDHLVRSVPQGASQVRRFRERPHEDVDLAHPQGGEVTEQSL